MRNERRGLYVGLQVKTSLLPGVVKIRKYLEVNNVPTMKASVSGVNAHGTFLGDTAL